MKKTKISTAVTFGSLIIILITLIIATFVEKAKGTEFVETYIYGSKWFVILWFVISFSGFLVIIKRKLYKQPITFLLHISFLVILLGAFLTFSTSFRGRIHLREGQTHNVFINKTNHKPQQLPFEIKLSCFEIDYYPGTQAPCDYISHITIVGEDGEINGTVSMNSVFSYNSYRFYQSSYDRDLKGSTLMVKSDRYGLPVTYAGYALLLIAMIGYFFMPNTNFRKLLNHPSLKKSVTIIVLISASVFSTFADNNINSNTISKENAKKMGEMQMLYRDRVCPMQTFTKDFTQKIYGKTSYKSLSSEQIVAGWLFYSSEWKEEPMIKVKSKTVRQIIGIKGKYASFSDFFIDGKTYKLTESLQKIRLGINVEDEKEIITTDEKVQLLIMLEMETLLKIFPYKLHDDSFVWYSPADKLPDEIPNNEKLLIRGSFSLLDEYAKKNDNSAFDLTLDKLKIFQQKSAGDILLSSKKISAERLYNSVNVVKPIAIINILIGIFALIFSFGIENKKNKLQNKDKIISKILNSILIISGLIIFVMICLRGYICGRIPLGNGYETLQFLAVCIMLFALIFRKKLFLFIPFGFIFSALVLFVSIMGSANPQITQLQPVLISPLLSIHVSLIMISYALFGFITFISLAAFVSIYTMRKKSFETLNNRMVQLAVFSRILLYPAVFLLAAGIFVGAVWAEISWGTYWSWDPKETWALITMIIYALPLHSSSLTRFNRPFFFHCYTLIAFLSVLMTYFGVNYILGGMHSYGGALNANLLIIIVLIAVVFIIMPIILIFLIKYKNKTYSNQKHQTHNS